MEGRCQVYEVVPGEGSIWSVGLDGNLLGLIVYTQKENAEGRNFTFNVASVAREFARAISRLEIPNKGL